MKRITSLPLFASGVRFSLTLKSFLLIGLFVLSAGFLSAQIPTIVSFSPISGPVGTSVLITGTNFSSPTTTDNAVYFGATKATVSLDGDNVHLNVTVPAGATYQTITVINSAGLIATSRIPFVLTFPGGGIDGSSFATRVNFTTGSGPNNPAIGDFNGDGKPDLVVCNGSSAQVSLFRNTSTTGVIDASTFTSQSALVTGTTPANLAIGDLDGDGKLDLVVANQGSNNISVFRNTTTIPSGSTIFFDTRQDFPTGFNSQEVALGDVDRDGKLDIAVANGGVGSNICIFRNTSTQGAISLATKVDFTPGSGPASLCFSDIDGDGHEDLVVLLQSSNTLSAFRNTGTPGAINAGSFALKKDYPTGSAPQGATSGDMDGDGKPDIVVVDFGSAQTSVFRNISVTSSIDLASALDLGAGAFPTDAAIGDIDGDGKPDLAVTNYDNNTASVFLNKSIVNNNNVDFAIQVPFITESGPSGSALADLDGDGKPELIVANSGSSNISVFRNTVVVPDALDPIVTSNLTSATATLGEFISVIAKFDGTGTPIDEAKIQYRSIASGPLASFQNVDMTGTGTDYSGTIPGTDVTDLGVEYKFLITDEAGNDNSGSQTLYKAPIHYSVGVPITSYPFSASGSAVDNYRMITIPFQGPTTVSDVFVAALGHYNKSVYRLFKYNGSTTAEFPYDELNENSPLTAGVGYWFIKKERTDIDTGIGTTVNVSTAAPFIMTLQPGWNQIGNPYPFNISWQDVIDANPTVDLSLHSGKLLFYRGGVGEGLVLGTFEGAFVQYVPDAPSSVTIEIPVTKDGSLTIGGRLASVSNKFTNSLDQASWEIMFDLKQGDQNYTLGGLGMDPKAKEGHDKFDNYNLPRFFDYLEIKFPKSIYGMTFTKDIVPTSENFTWEFNAESNLKDEAVSLSWDNSYFGNAKEIFLLDLATHRAIDMRTLNHYDFKRSESRTFRVVFGSEEYVKAQLVPDKVILFDPYPSPFTDRVAIEFALPDEANNLDGAIEIFDTMGSTVSTINTPKQSGPGGWIWESEGHARGFYIVRLKLGNQVVVKKMVKQ